jgi:hypothetical protein
MTHALCEAKFAEYLLDDDVLDGLENHRDYRLSRESTIYLSADVQVIDFTSTAPRYLIVYRQYSPGFL